MHSFWRKSLRTLGESGLQFGVHLHTIPTLLQVREFNNNGDAMVLPFRARRVAVINHRNTIAGSNLLTPILPRDFC